jgi:hypothetical protein
MYLLVYLSINLSICVSIHPGIIYNDIVREEEVLLTSNTTNKDNHNNNKNNKENNIINNNKVINDNSSMDIEKGVQFTEKGSIASTTTTTHINDLTITTSKYHVPIIPIIRTIECGQCQLERPRSARHCIYCGSCCEGLDHHCPWCGKCIGDISMHLWIYLFIYLITS